MASFERRPGNRWRARVTRGWKRYSATFGTKGQAEAWAARTEAGISEGVLPKPSNRKLRALEQRVFFAGSLPVKAVPDILAVAQPYSPVCGIYFLIHKGEVVYVGQSSDVHSRLASHRTRMTFDSVSIFPHAREDLTIYETHYIASLKPRLNRILPKAMTARTHLV